ncbi:hypothetical protein ASPSYDRAFT_658697 [Aspergillus sydowii CBS 593.65]|uniref:F-box domain-containing protein n=1 Tax=Aspergillus sydowii CBS 593.65 TaxID=1036612 RepID=A0A1L9TTG9_9EURO|nr:uncharacterized protein ASPSYDRAFT_658697 [Aspergillus sydowii CBS 593.65]OJJ62675.1 hypothetical protein ASPSYDRAFT_658697 [Aspergillus sydowii CBS 593.65]
MVIWFKQINKSVPNIKLIMESLPQDILLDILARLDTKSLLSLCLVSKPMHFVSRPLLFQSFDGYHPARSLKRLRIFSQQLQKNTYLVPQVRSIDVGYIKEPYIGELQTPNLRHLCVPAGHFIEFLNNLLKRQNYLSELRSFETYYGPRIYKPLQCWSSILGLRQLSSLKIRRCARWEWLSVWEYDTLLTPTPPDLIPPELQGRGDLLLRHITIGESNVGYTILARLIQSSKRLETFSYQSASGWDAEDSEPTTIIQAL